MAKLVNAATSNSTASSSATTSPTLQAYDTATLNQDIAAANALNSGTITIQVLNSIAAGNAATTINLKPDVTLVLLNESGKAVSLGAIDGAGTIIQQGSGRTVVEGLITSKGTIKVEGGVFEADGGISGVAYKSAFPIVDDGLVVLGNGGGGATISGSGSVDIEGNVTFFQENTYTGKTEITAGVLTLQYLSSISASSEVNISEGARFDIQQYGFGGGDALPFGASLKQLSGSGEVDIENNSLSISGSGVSNFSGVITSSQDSSINPNYAPGERVYLSGASDQARLILSGNNTYIGGTFIGNGTVELVAQSAAGRGDVVFNTSASRLDETAQLQLDAGALPTSGGTFSNKLDNFGDNDALDLRGLAYQAGATATLQGNTLIVASGGTTINFDLVTPGATRFYAQNDGKGGTLVTDTPPGASLKPNPVLAVPASLAAQAGVTQSVFGISLSDPWAGRNPGLLALNVTASSGTIASTDATGNVVAGSGTGAIHISGTLAQVQADLAHLTYTGGSSGDGTLTVDVWDQAGVEATRTIGITNPTQVIDPAQADTVVTLTNGKISAASGDHMIFISHTGNTLVATGGVESVQAYQGRNTITTGAGNDTIRFAGSGDVIDAGGGSNVLADSGGGNRIVLPGAGQGFDDIFGYTLQNGDVFDLRAALLDTTWNGNSRTLGQYLHVASANGGADLAVSLSSTAGGAATQIALLRGEGAQGLGVFEAASVFR